MAFLGYNQFSLHGLYALPCQSVFATIQVQQQFNIAAQVPIYETPTVHPAQQRHMIPSSYEPLPPIRPRIPDPEPFHYARKQPNTRYDEDKHMSTRSTRRSGQLNTYQPLPSIDPLTSMRNRNASPTSFTRNRPWSPSPYAITSQPPSNRSLSSRYSFTRSPLSVSRNGSNSGLSNAPGGSESESSCDICCEVEPKALLLPCEHSSACISCVRRINSETDQCPFCRTRISEILTDETT